MRTKAWAKVNLALNIARRRPDGYHDLETVMHRIDLADDVEVIMGSGSMGAGRRAITVTVTSDADLDVAGVPCGRGNTAFRAAKAFLESLGRSESVSIGIRKRIPVGAGLGGGSADAAAVLVAMNQLWGKPYGREKLMAIGASIGADVPFCLMNHDFAGDGADGSAPVHAAFAQGIGDRLTPLPGLQGVGLLLVTPGFAVSTSDAYAMWDARFVKGVEHEGRDAQEPNAARPPARPTARRLAEVLSLARSRAECADASRDLQRVCSLMSNDFEPLIDRRYGQIVQMKQLMIQVGAIGSLMSGSGPTVFGMYGSPGQAGAAAGVLGSLAANCGFDMGRHGSAVTVACTGDSGS